MAPNIYVHISLLQVHEQTKNDLPIRLYGVIPILVENAETVLVPKLEMPEVLKPEEKFRLKVSEEKGKCVCVWSLLADGNNEMLMEM